MKLGVTARRMPRHNQGDALEPRTFSRSRESFQSRATTATLTFPFFESIQTQSAKMTRATQTISIFLLVSSVCPAPRTVVCTELMRCLTALPSPLPWLDPLANKDSGGHHSLRTLCPTSSRQSHRQNTDRSIQLPFWALISFGAYLLGKLGYNVMTFHDVPEAHKELMAEIEVARADLKKMGVEVD